MVGLRPRQEADHLQPPLRQRHHPDRRTRKEEGSHPRTLPHSAGVRSRQLIMFLWGLFLHSRSTSSPLASLVKRTWLLWEDRKLEWRLEHRRATASVEGETTSVTEDGSRASGRWACDDDGLGGGQSGTDRSRRRRHTSRCAATNLATSPPHRNGDAAHCSVPRLDPPSTQSDTTTYNPNPMHRRLCNYISSIHHSTPPLPTPFVLLSTVVSRSTDWLAVQCMSVQIMNARWRSEWYRSRARESGARSRAADEGEGARSHLRTMRPSSPAPAMTT